MKAKKALKRLRRVEELLSLVIDEFVGKEPSVRESLNAAKASVIRAKMEINPNPKKTQPKAKRTKRSDFRAGERKGISLASKERSIGAKRTLERKIRTSVKSIGERDTAAKSEFSTPQMVKPADRPLASEASQEPNQDRHAN